MKLYRFTKVSIAVSCSLSVITACNCKKTIKAKPNIIIVLADDQGWGDMGYNDHPVLKTPNFDDMAATGLRFDRFYAAAPVCSPTRGSLMTGRHPNRFGCFSWGFSLRPQEITIAEALKKADYITGHFGKWHLGPVFTGSPVNPGASGFDEWFSTPNFFENDPILSREGIAIQTYGESSMVTVNAALAFIKEHVNLPQSFFAFLCFGSPHLPHIADEQDKLLYADQETKFQNFYGEITGMDRAVGKLRKEIKKMGIEKNTILWYLSDNGGLKNLGSSGGRGHKGDIYEGGLRVPSILEWPSEIKKPRITSVPCMTSDIFPTLLEIAGVKINNQHPLDGISLLPLIKNDMKVRTKPIGFWEYTNDGKIVSGHKIMQELLHNQQTGNMLVDSSLLQLDAGNINKQYPLNTFPGHAAWLIWPHKLHRIENMQKEIIIELYNLEEDPMEENNLVAKENVRAQKMKIQLENWLFSVVESLNGKDYR